MNTQPIKRAFLFTMITFAITYSSWLIFMYYSRTTGVKVFDNSPLGLLMLIGLFAPSVVGAVMRFIHRPVTEKNDLRKILFYLPVALIIPIIFVLLDQGIGQLVQNLINPSTQSPSAANSEILTNIPQSMGMVITAFALSIVFGGLEELGWRGYLLPQLLKVLSPFKANLMVASLWIVWHVPLFFLPGAAQYQTNFIIFALGLLTLSNLMTYLWLKTQSVALAIVVHASFNTMAALGFGSANTLGQMIVSLVIALISLRLVENQRCY